MSKYFLIAIAIAVWVFAVFMLYLASIPGPGFGPWLVISPANAQTSHCAGAWCRVENDQGKADRARFRAYLKSKGEKK